MLNCKMATKVLNNWKCRLSTNFQVDIQAHSFVPTFTRQQVEANYNWICHHLCLSRPLWGGTMCTKYCGSHKFARHLLSSNRQGTNVTGMPWLFTEMKNLLLLHEVWGENQWRNGRTSSTQRRSWSLGSLCWLKFTVSPRNIQKLKVFQQPIVRTISQVYLPKSHD